MSDHYYTERPRSDPREKAFSCRLRNRSFTFTSAAGTFAKYRIDAATELLIENSRVNRGDRILDLGCGVGIIGIALGRSRNAQVVMIEINMRAAQLARKNALENNVEVDVREGSLYDPLEGERFDVIISNPPMAAGRDLCYQIIELAPKHLNPGGSLQLVARHKKGGAMLEQKMVKVFGSCETLAKKGGFRVYCSRI